MDFDLTEDQREIRGVARELLAARSPWAKVREAAEAGRYDQRLWDELVALGWPGSRWGPSTADRASERLSWGCASERWR